MEREGNIEGWREGEKGRARVRENEGAREIERERG
jgi:hypothetical protein